MSTLHRAQGARLFGAATAVAISCLVFATTLAFAAENAPVAEDRVAREEENTTRRGLDHFQLIGGGNGSRGQIADLSVSKSVSDERPNESDVITYTIEVTNLGPDTAAGVEVTDALPVETTYQSSVASQGSYDDATGLWDIGQIVVGETQVLTITVTIDSTVVNPGASEAIANTASVTGSVTIDGIPENDSDTAGLVLQAADLGVAKSVDDAMPNEGDTVTFTIELSNAGPDDATGVEVLDLLPEGLAFVSQNATIGSYDSGTGIWNVGIVPASGSETLAIRAAIEAGAGGGTIVNGATVNAADQADGNPDNDGDTARVEPRAAELALAKDVDVAAPSEGDMITYTVSVSNHGPHEATGVQILDDLPAGLSFESSSATVGSYDGLSGIWNVGTVANGATEILSITANVEPGAAGFAIVNTASVSAVDQADPDPTNDSADVGIQVRSIGIGQVQITNAGSSDQRPTWSPDGTRIAFDRTAGQVVDLYGVLALGPDPAFQITTRTVSDVHPDWSGDGGRIVFAAPSVAGGVTDLWLIAPGGGVPALLAADASGTDRFPAWSPDGNLVAFNKDSGSGNDIYVIDATGGAPTPITTDAGNDVHPSWSPDGAMIVFLSNRSGNNDLWTIPAAGGTATQLTTNVANDGAPDWSPDGTQIAFQSNRSGNNDIWIIPAAGGTAVRVTTDLGIDAQPDWSPAGNQIAFARDGNIWVHTFTDPGDPAIVLRLDRASAAREASVTYEIEVTNRGEGFCSGLEIAHVLPSGLSLISAKGTQGVYDAASGRWRAGSLTPGSSATLKIVAEIGPQARRTVGFDATLVSLHQEDLDLTNNVALATLAVTGNDGNGNGDGGGSLRGGSSLPTEYALSRARPNPFRSGAGIDFDLPRDGRTELAIFDVTGRRVATLLSEVLTAGRYHSHWDGRDLDGRAVAPGVYFVRLESGSFRATERVIRLK